jgi:hypothetical protein
MKSGLLTSHPAAKCNAWLTKLLRKIDLTVMQIIRAVAVSADDYVGTSFHQGVDRRYALLDRDPTAGNNKSTSEWMANLLAYRALCLFPCVITCTGSTTAGWNSALDEPCFTWPIWQAPLPPDTIRSLLGHAALVTRDIPSTLRHLGIAAAYRSRRIENGDYVNFSPAQGVF